MSRRSSTHRPIGRRSVPVLALATLLTGLVPAGPSRAAVEVVTKASVSYPHFTTIQDAVNAAARGDWVLIDVGVHPGADGVWIENLTLRNFGMRGSSHPVT